MIKFSELKEGDYVMVDFEGKMWRGVVTDLNHDEKQICVETEVQDFWYEPAHVYPIPLNDEELMRLNFTKEIQEDGSVKYKKGPFRLEIPEPDNFSQLEMWYREDRRHNPRVHYIHELQNQYLQMTKVHLTDQVIA
ncbi:hypothetical protein FC093_10360 [Ilyomonas limi]|uniref:Uncharacterized protein n=1 Tax=Ilyomonas limi TaxID=2575867 RepID=A0A4U3L4M6_9BACT|nr:hypothetical protein [Ilyomonas limi]TKK68517.1 hypothetical protein FC093_10360 [Ilyomonas limi]